MAHNNSNGPRNLTDAIDRLEQATHSKSQEFKDLLGKDYSDLKKALEDLKPHLSEITDKVTDHVKSTKKDVEDKLHENPWTTIAVVGLIGLFIGWIFGFSNRRDR